MFKALAIAALLTGVVATVPIAQAPAASLERLSWLSGCWTRTRPDGLTEEHWMKPAGGTMLGMGRSVKGDRTTEFEFLQIREVAGKLAYIAKPSGQPEGDVSCEDAVRCRDRVRGPRPRLSAARHLSQERRRIADGTD